MHQPQSAAGELLSVNMKESILEGKNEKCPANAGNLRNSAGDWQILNDNRLIPEFIQVFG